MISYKLLAHCFIFDPLYLTLFFTSTKAMEGASLGEIKTKLKNDLATTYLIDVAVSAPYRQSTFVGFLWCIKRWPYNLQYWLECLFVLCSTRTSLNKEDRIRAFNHSIVPLYFKIKFTTPPIHNKPPAKAQQQASTLLTIESNFPAR